MSDETEDTETRMTRYAREAFSRETPITLGLAIAIIAALVSAAVWAGRIDNRIESLEKRVHAVELREWQRQIGAVDVGATNDR